MPSLTVRTGMRFVRQREERLGRAGKCPAFEPGLVELMFHHLISETGPG
jgi:hypothetical protein